MKLSEAIRLGAMMKPPARGQYFVAGHSCALGAAADATDTLAESTALQQRFPILLKRMGDSRLFNLIVEWNDFEFCSREEIADRVERIERAQEDTTPIDADTCYATQA